MNSNYDIIVIGNGMVGASISCALSAMPLRIAIVDQHLRRITSAAPVLSDGRKIALSFGSCKILEQLRIWQHCAKSVSAIQQVQISRKNTFGVVRIDAEAMHVASMGYVIAAEKLQQALDITLQKYKTIDWFEQAILTAIDLGKHNTIHIKQNERQQTLSAKLIIAADGVLSPSRRLLNIPIVEKDYQQTALVASIQVTQATTPIAYQRLLGDAVLAMLPMQGQRYGVVYTAPTTKTKALLALDDAALLNELQQQFGYRLGRLKQLGKRFTYPLKMIIAERQTKPGFVLLGNAAHTISPIAAQGFNLALQDIYCLYRLLQTHSNDYDLALNLYRQQRQQEQQRIIDFTDRLTRYYSIDHGLLAAAALIGTDLLPNIKRHFAQLGMGLTPQVQTLLRTSYVT